MKPQLSVLIPSVPSRFDRAIKLYNKIMGMVGDKNIEVLLFTDNKKRSIGEKREALKNISKGKYFFFADDDDDVLSLDELYEHSFNDVDVITFKQRCRNADGSDFIVTFGLGNEVEHKVNAKGNYEDIHRPPFHVCAWNEKFRDIHFPDVSYSEDWEWVKQVLPKAFTESHIDKVVHAYNFDINVTEASTESNAFWKNPNEL